MRNLERVCLSDMIKVEIAVGTSFSFRVERVQLCLLDFFDPMKSFKRLKKGSVHIEPKYIHAYQVSRQSLPPPQKKRNGAILLIVKEETANQ